MPIPEGWGDGRNTPQRDGLPADTDAAQIIHMKTPGVRPALDTCDEIVFPVSPTTALLYGLRGESSLRMPTRFEGSDAEALALEMNLLQIENAIDWVGAHPNHPTFAQLEWSSPTPLLNVSDGGTVMGRQLRETTRRRPFRLRKHTTS
jgi:hypothetical protein